MFPADVVPSQTHRAVALHHRLKQLARIGVGPIYLLTPMHLDLLGVPDSGSAAADHMWPFRGGIEGPKWFLRDLVSIYVERPLVQVAPPPN
jgi:hypothetical protein